MCYLLYLSYVTFLKFSMFCLTLERSYSAVQPSKFLLKVTETVEKKMQQKMDSKEKKNNSPDFQKSREMKTSWDNLLFILIA